MGWSDEFAAELKSRDNRPMVGPQIGEVVSTRPLRISVMQNNVILEEGMIYLCSALAEQQRRKASFHLENADVALQTVHEQGSISGTGEIVFSEVLKIGDRVACIPVEGNQKFIVFDKVVG